MRLTDLNPRWYAAHGRPGRIGIIFLCPHCRMIEIPVAFENPRDGADPDSGARTRWKREGETFEALTLTPSVDASSFGHWHGFVTNGEVT